MTDIDMRQLMEYEEEKKSLAATYVLWAVLGPFGAHRFYLEKTGSAVAMLILTLTLFGVVITVIWWIVDAVNIPSMVKDLNRGILDDITSWGRYGTV
ncbi:MAG: TM2 domain-containing protein [Gammaproteobacteria bacterium]|nr:TM2 domain-containing protein [Gammaproteobacteria bacterium]